MHGNPPPLHSPEPSHLPLGKLVDGCLQTAEHLLVTHFPCHIKGHILVLQAIVNQVVCRNAIGQQRTHLVHHPFVQALFQAASDFLPAKITGNVHPYRQPGQRRETTCIHRVRPIVFFYLNGANGTLRRIYVGGVVQFLVRGQQSSQFVQRFPGQFLPQKRIFRDRQQTVTPKDLGEIVISDITLGQGADFNFSPGEIISNPDKLPLCEGDSIDDLNLVVKITKSSEKPNFYYITLESKEGSSSNYTYTIKGGTLSTDFPITDPIDPDMNIDPDFSVVTQTPLEPAKRHPNFKKALSDSRCDYCTKRGEIFKKNLNKKGELKFDNAVQGLNVEKSRKEIAEFKDF